MKRSKKIVTIHDLPYHLSHSTFGDSIKAWRQCDEMSIRAMAKRLGHPIETWVELALQDHLEKGKLKLKVSVTAA